MKMPPQVRQVFERIDEMSIRERAMVALTVLAVLWALWDGLLMRPLSALENARRDQLSSLSSQVADLNRSIQSLAAGPSGDGEQAARRQLAELRNRIVETDTRLREATRELVPPQDMSALLETMLVRAGNLQLVGMQTLPSQPIVADGVETGFYRHGLQVDVRGSYLDTLAYLQSLEGLQWRFLWEAVELRVAAHPVSHVRIVVYTLGQTAGAIGV